MGKELKVLVIDDDDNIRENIVFYLEDCGYQVVDAENGKVGIDKYIRELPDVTITDLYMPEMDGFGVIEGIRKENSNHPIIVSSGAGEVAAVVKAIKLGADDFLIKPLSDMLVLTNSVDKVYEKSRLVEENIKYRKELEDKVNEKQMLNELLKHSLHNLEKTKDQLVIQKKLSALGAVTREIAHELQNPLNFVINFAEGLQQMISSCEEELKKIGGTEELQEDIQTIDFTIGKIIYNGQRMNSIIQNMFAYSKDNMENVTLVKLDLLVSEYLEIALSDIRQSDGSHNIRVEPQLNASEAIELFPQSLGRALDTIFTNAIYEIQTKKKNNGDKYIPTLRIFTSISNNYAEVKIRDNGNGIKEDLIGSIFDPFCTTKKDLACPGLGLSVAYDIIVELHGGKIDVSSKVGEYTEFRIVLPKVQKSKK